MKKLMLLALLVYVTSCSAPEDKAEGSADSSSLNTTDNKKSLNTPGTSVGNQSQAGNSDTSSSPSASKQNADSATKGTNRSYGKARDTTKH